MKSIIIELFFLFFCLSTYGQSIDNSINGDSSNIYNQSFIRYFQYLDENNYKIPDSIIIEEDFKLTDSLMGQLGKTKLIIVRQSDILRLVHKESEEIYRLFPLVLKNKEFMISIIPFRVTRKGRNLFYSNGGGFHVYYTYLDGQLMFKRSEYIGL
jgi:hypothetical protein